MEGGMILITTITVKQIHPYPALIRKIFPGYVVRPKGLNTNRNKKTNKPKTEDFFQTLLGVKSTG
jgi:hypothetical protein